MTWPGIRWWRDARRAGRQGPWYAASGRGEDGLVLIAPPGVTGESYTTTCATSPRAPATSTPLLVAGSLEPGDAVAIAGPYRSAGRGSSFDQLRPNVRRLTSRLVSRNLPFVATNESQQDAWNVLADRTRRAILESLADGPAPSVRSPTQLPVSRPAVSQHLKVLKASGLVSEEAHGTRHIFRLDPAGVSALRDQLDTFWNRALANFEAAIDDTDDPVEDQ